MSDHPRFVPSASFTIRVESDVQRILNEPGAIGLYRKPRVLIRIPAMSSKEATAWEMMLENLRHECGCRAGTIAVGVFTLLFVIYSLTDKHPASPINVIFLIGLAVFGLILSGGIGKLIGLHLARNRFKKTCEQLIARLRSNDWRDDRISAVSPVLASVMNRVRPCQGCGR